MTTLTKEQLDAAIAEEPALMLVFLRHRGCLFTRQLIESTQTAAEQWHGRVILVHQNPAEEYDTTLEPLWPNADHVADPQAELYQRFAVQRGGMNEMFGLRSWLAGIKAFLRGHRIGSKGNADGWTLPTVIWFENGTVVREHHGQHAGDHPDFDLAAR